MEDDISLDLKEIAVSTRNWIDLTQERLLESLFEYRKRISMVINLTIYSGKKLVTYVGARSKTAPK